MNEVVQGVEVASSSCADEEQACFAVTWSGSQKTNHGEAKQPTATQQLLAVHTRAAMTHVIAVCDRIMSGEVVYG